GAPYKLIFFRLLVGGTLINCFRQCHHCRFIFIFDLAERHSGGGAYRHFFIRRQKVRKRRNRITTATLTQGVGDLATHELQFVLEEGYQSIRSITRRRRSKSVCRRYAHTWFRVIQGSSSSARSLGPAHQVEFYQRIAALF